MVFLTSMPEVAPFHAMEPGKANIGLVTLKLSGEDKSRTWTVNKAEPDEEVTHDLKLHQIILDRKAVKDEEQIVEVEFMGADRQKVTLPLAYLIRGKTDQQRLDVQFPAGTAFSLAEGNGPVWLLGSHVISTNGDDDVVESEDLEEEVDEEEDEEENGIEENAAGGEQVSADESGSKKRKQDGERENGSEAKKIKSTSQNAKSDVDEEEAEDSSAME